MGARPATHHLKSIAELDEHSRALLAASLAAPEVGAFLARSPSALLGSVDAGGEADVSPKGDPPGFVQVLDDATLAVPDRPATGAPTPSTPSWTAPTSGCWRSSRATTGPTSPEAGRGRAQRASGPGRRELPGDASSSQTRTVARSAVSLVRSRRARRPRTRRIDAGPTRSEA